MISNHKQHNVPISLNHALSNNLYETNAFRKEYFDWFRPFSIEGMNLKIMSSTLFRNNHNDMYPLNLYHATIHDSKWCAENICGEEDCVLIICSEEYADFKTSTYLPSTAIYNQCLSLVLCDTKDIFVESNIISKLSCDRSISVWMSKLENNCKWDIFDIQFRNDSKKVKFKTDANINNFESHAKEPRKYYIILSMNNMFENFRKYDELCIFVIHQNKWGVEYIPLINTSNGIQMKVSKNESKPSIIKQNHYYYDNLYQIKEIFQKVSIEDYNTEDILRPMYNQSYSTYGERWIILSDYAPSPDNKNVSRYKLIDENHNQCLHNDFQLKEILYLINNATNYWFGQKNEMILLFNILKHDDFQCSKCFKSNTNKSEVINFTKFQYIFHQIHLKLKCQCIQTNADQNVNGNICFEDDMIRQTKSLASFEFSVSGTIIMVGGSDKVKIKMYAQPFGQKGSDKILAGFIIILFKHTKFRMVVLWFYILYGLY
jgi:hypothetical protein